MKYFVYTIYTSGDGASLYMKTLDEIVAFYHEVDDDTALDFRGQLYNFLWDYIVFVAEYGDEYSTKGDEFFPYDINFMQEIAEWLGFEYEEVDYEAHEYDLEEGWERQIRIFEHPTTHKLYALDGTWDSSCGSFCEWNVRDMYEVEQQEVKIIQYAPVKKN